ncbi:MAG: hypothetical protein R3E95_19215 [Thiolinea sp.]
MLFLPLLRHGKAELREPLSRLWLGWLIIALGYFLWRGPQEPTSLLYLMPPLLILMSLQAGSATAAAVCGRCY